MDKKVSAKAQRQEPGFHHHTSNTYFDQYIVMRIPLCRYYSRRSSNPLLVLFVRPALINAGLQMGQVIMPSVALTRYPSLNLAQQVSAKQPTPLALIEVSTLWLRIHKAVLRYG